MAAAVTRCHGVPARAPFGFPGGGHANVELDSTQVLVGSGGNRGGGGCEQGAYVGARIEAGANHHYVSRKHAVFRGSNQVQRCIHGDADSIGGTVAHLLSRGLKAVDQRRTAESDEAAAFKCYVAAASHASQLLDGGGLTVFWNCDFSIYGIQAGPSVGLGIDAGIGISTQMCKIWAASALGSQRVYGMLPTQGCRCPTCWRKREA